MSTLIGNSTISPSLLSSYKLCTVAMLKARAKRLAWCLILINGLLQCVEIHRKACTFVSTPVKPLMYAMLTHLSRSPNACILTPDRRPSPLKELAFLAS